MVSSTLEAGDRLLALAINQSRNFATLRFAHESLYGYHPKHLGVASGKEGCLTT